MEIEKLIDTYSEYLYRIAFIYTKDRLTAEEVVQDVFINYYHKSCVVMPLYLELTEEEVFLY